MIFPLSLFYTIPRNTIGRLLNEHMDIGSDRQFLIDVISQCLPYIGYTRSLNALTFVNNSAKQMEESK